MALKSTLAYLLLTLGDYIWFRLMPEAAIYLFYFLSYYFILSFSAFLSCLRFVFLLMVCMTSGLPRSKTLCLNTLPMKLPLCFWKSYMLSYLMNEAYLLWLKYVGNIWEQKLCTLVILKPFPLSSQQIIGSVVGSFIKSKSLTRNEVLTSVWSF